MTSSEHLGRISRAQATSDSALGLVVERSKWPMIKAARDLGGGIPAVAADLRWPTRGCAGPTRNQRYFYHPASTHYSVHGNEH